VPDRFFVLTILVLSPAVLTYVGAYSHRYFVRGNRKLCHLITRTPNSASMLRRRSPSLTSAVDPRAEFKSEEGKESVVKDSPRTNISSGTTRTIQNQAFLHSNSNFYFSATEDVDNYRQGSSLVLHSGGEPGSQLFGADVSSSKVPRLQNRSWLQNHEEQLSKYASQLVLGPPLAKKNDDTCSPLDKNLKPDCEISDEIISIFR
jgi:hypothetical protein